jgi:hypothetical protein
MVYLNVRQQVADFDKWRLGFDANEANRLKAGATGVHHIYRDLDNPNTVSIMMEWDNAENARRFAHDPALEEVSRRAGVLGMPERYILRHA